jgi:adenylosuccinate lyase
MNLSIFDGRYKKYCIDLINILSEEAYINYRYNIELDYLSKLIKFVYNEDYNFDNINLKDNNEINEINSIKDIENKIRHDVKAIEYYIKDKLKDFKYTHLVHIGLTSQDINSLANSIMIKNASNVCINKFKEIKIDILLDNIVIITKTHGQCAVPSTMNKEISFHYIRICKTIGDIENIKLTAKFGGAVGTMAAHYFAFNNNNYNNYNWVNFFDNFVNSYGFNRTQITTQIDDYTSYVQLLQLYKLLLLQINNFAKYLRFLIKDEYMCQKVINEEVGSSTMPQKINPIDFENLKGNVVFAKNSIDALIEILMDSEYQRDLSDSTGLRSLSTIFGYIMIVINSFKNGIERISINHVKINEEVDMHYEVILEGIQTKLKLLGVYNAYDEIKLLSRGKKITKEIISDYICKLDINDDDKKQLLNLEPRNYLGTVKCLI